MLQKKAKNSMAVVQYMIAVVRGVSGLMLVALRSALYSSSNTTNLTLLVQEAWRRAVLPSTLLLSVEMEAGANVMIGQHERSVNEAIPRFPLLFLFYHYQHLKKISRLIKPTVELLSYILHDSSISRDPTFVICLSEAQWGYVAPHPWKFIVHGSMDERVHSRVHLTRLVAGFHNG